MLSSKWVVCDSCGKRFARYMTVHSYSKQVQNWVRLCEDCARVEVQTCERYLFAPENKRKLGIAIPKGVRA